MKTAAIFSVLAMLGAACGDDGALSKRLLSVCSGAFECTFPDGSTARSELGLDGQGECFAGGILLAATGDAIASNARAHWNATQQGFDICASDGCAVCKLDHPLASSDASSGGSCSGSPRGCESFSVGSGCTAQAGCYVHYHYHFDGSTELQCAGSPDSCHSFKFRDSCEAQRGCYWE